MRQVLGSVEPGGCDRLAGADGADAAHHATWRVARLWRTIWVWRWWMCASGAADLPEREPRTPPIDRMKAEREREAADERARGEEAGPARCAPTADREATEIVSDAQRPGRQRSSAVRPMPSGTGSLPRRSSRDRGVLRLLPLACKAYETCAERSSNSTLVISPDSEFFNYLKTGSAGSKRRVREADVRWT